MTGKKQPRVSVLMGSDSDMPVMKGAVEILKEFGVAVEVEVTSAHRTPERTRDIVCRAPERGVVAFIVGAGAAAHLAGTVAAWSTLPVLGVPLASSTLQGLDALLATVQMPAGIPVGTLAIGEAGARNAALLAVSIMALSDPDLAGRLARYRREMGEKVSAKATRARDGLDGVLSADDA